MSSSTQVWYKYGAPPSLPYLYRAWCTEVSRDPALPKVAWRGAVLRGGGGEEGNLNPVLPGTVVLLAEHRVLIIVASVWCLVAAAQTPQAQLVSRIMDFVNNTTFLCTD